MTPGTGQRLAWSLVLAMILTVGTGPALASAETGASSAAPVTDAHERARALFDRGQVQYALGEYDQAIALFREAYELSSAPILLFNIAQAHRLKGDCAHAVELYRHFVRIAPDAPLAEEARRHISTLAPTCALDHRAPPAPEAEPALEDVRPAAPVLGSSSSPPGPGPVDRPRSSARVRLTRSLLVGGLAVAVGAGGLALWNNHRHNQWTAEDAQLRAGPQAGTDPGPWIARQDKNDALLRSIWRVDTATGVLVGVSAASILACAIVGQFPDRGVQVSLGPNAVQVAWVARLP
jgi:tetratricopeptide (TPR) repeat protein